MKKIALIGGGATNLLLASLLSKHQNIKDSELSFGEVLHRTMKNRK